MDLDRRWMITLLVSALLVLSGSPAHAELPVAQMHQAIDRGVDYLISQQQANGCWPFDIDWVRGTTYDVGMTSLCTLALAHTRLPKAGAAVHKGLSYVTQHKPEPTTYTAGLIEMLLFENGAVQHKKLISRYALMTVLAQKRTGPQEGSWGYLLVDLQAASGRQGRGGVPAPPRGRSDHSNSQFGVLALWYAQRAGYQVPVRCWKRVKKHYEATQHADGGWGYEANAGQGQTTPSMTPASCVSLYLADEALTSREHKQCKMVPENPAVERGMAWIGQRGVRGGPYTCYAIERLGILTGRSEFGGHNWMEEGARALIRGDWSGARGGERAGTAFAVLFLARALEPIIINKLKRKGDWNNDAYDIKHLTEFISVKFQYPKQWRIVTLDASVEELLKVPILYTNGHEALAFTDAEKTKLKEYVNRGGTIFAMACCARKEFDQSFRALVAELWPENRLTPLPKEHTIYTNPRPLGTKPELLGMALSKGQGRLGVIYSPHDMCCRWHMGGTRANPVFDVGANIYFYVAKVGVKLGGVREGYSLDTAKGE